MGLSAGDPVPVELGVVATMIEEPSVMGEASPFMGDCPPFMALWWLITGDADWDNGCAGWIGATGADTATGKRFPAGGCEAGRAIYPGGAMNGCWNWR